MKAFGNIPDAIFFNSPELAAYHEAGHAEAALSLGARVVQIVLHVVESGRSYGRTRIERTPQQSPHIALGGFAAELLLFRSGRLRKQDGDAPTEKEFIDSACDNAADDKIAVFGADLREPDGTWPKELDSKFMAWAIGHSETMRFDVVERLAHALLAAHELDEEAVRELASPSRG